MADFKRVAPSLDQSESYFNKDGTPTANGLLVLAMLDELRARSGGPQGSLGVALKPYSKANLPTAAEGGGRLIYVTDDAGGEVPAFCDSAGAWRRVTDRNVIS